jgi:hypothetical protein
MSSPKISRPPPVPENPNLTLTQEVCDNIQLLASCGLARDEILDGYCVDYDKLETDEQILVTQYYAWGKLKGLSDAAQDLKKHSSGRGGFPATMQFLRRFAKQFEKAIDEDTPANLRDGFTFHFNPTD